MLVTFLGVRGSIAAPGHAFARYGGETSCIAVSGHGEDVPTLVLDAGSGIRSLTRLLGGAPYRGQILLSHLHWDHVHGLPFFAAADRDDARVQVLLPAQDGRSGYQLLAASMSPPSFPIGPDGLRGRWRFDAVEPGPLSAGDYGVRAVEVAHKGGRTFGYRVERDGGSIAYIPDHAPYPRVRANVADLIHNVDLLIHDGQYLSSERVIARAFGHCTVEDAVELAHAAQVGTLVLFHHAPDRTDDALDAIAADLARASRTNDTLRIVLATQGDTVVVGGSTGMADHLHRTGRTRPGSIEAASR